ncbi:MAG: dihydrofolate reductase family protein [Acidobacteriia bacterium]|nr:dihydrofolate reductase family protein [Terriglobia bacterium]
MKRKRKIVTYIATSADGYIARADGSVDWLDRPRPKGNYGMGAFFRTIDTILWGRKTYDQSLEMTGGVGSGFGLKVKNYIFTHHPPGTPAPGVEFVNEPITAFAKRIRAQAGKDIMMMGGAGLIASFLDEREIDEFIIHVLPVFIGEGIPLIEPRRRTVRLALVSSRRFPDGVVRHHYRVLPKTDRVLPQTARKGS